MFLPHPHYLPVLFGAVLFNEGKLYHSTIGFILESSQLLTHNDTNLQRPSPVLQLNKSTLQSHLVLFSVYLCINPFGYL